MTDNRRASLDSIVATAVRLATNEGDAVIKIHAANRAQAAAVFALVKRRGLGRVNEQAGRVDCLNRTKIIVDVVRPTSPPRRGFTIIGVMPEYLSGRRRRRSTLSGWESYLE